MERCAELGAEDCLYLDVTAPAGAHRLPGLRGSGTFGLQDQQAALSWVRRNAAAFGGDPRKCWPGTCPSTATSSPSATARC
ncbi:carboxylesterase family protein [Actinoplanes sp. N902-109]|uniref:carboxylesterase family protein n=1 Tax=Actinoplanes sp. (strain N902-109) TaxID=649831 RepID=UPI0003295724|nr:carboxylesterase family protein [Actinoplanes sp. N902-109]AGL18011.1 carboxylesterase [Actinoplanes sp. N902-109]